MHGDLSGIGSFFLAFAAIPLGAIVAAILAAIAYRRRALGTYWFVILASYLSPWLLVLGNKEVAAEFWGLLRDPEPGMTAINIVPVIGAGILLAGCHYYVRHTKVKRSRGVP